MTQTTIPTVHVGKSFEGASPVMLARVRGGDGSYVQQADVSSIAYAIYDLDDTETAGDSGALDKTTVIFDALQTDDRWVEDSTGYNFRWLVDTSKLPAAAATYQLEVLIALDSGGVAVLVWQQGIVNIYSLPAA